MSKRIIAVDFDGVLHRYSKGWNDGTCYDEPMEGAFESIVTLQKRGYEIVVLTARNADDVAKWLRLWIGNRKASFKADEMSGLYSIKATNTKPGAIAYIDDRGIRFVSWRDVLNYF